MVSHCNLRQRIVVSTQSPPKYGRYSVTFGFGVPPRRDRIGTYCYSPFGPVLINVLLRSSLSATCSSSRVFITIGPYQATGSSIGRPETRRKRILLARLHDDFVAATKGDERTIAGHRPNGIVVLDVALGEHAGRHGRITKVALALEHIRKGVRPRVHLEVLLLARRHGHVEVSRIRGDAIDRPFLPQNSPMITRTFVPSSSVTSAMSCDFTSW